MSINFSELEVLNQIEHPRWIQRLDISRLEQLARELRKVIINTVAENGGHLAPSLGTVELTLALYSVLDPSYDKIIWDVGHQAYSHKLLTGRLDRFHTLRTKGGITGFPKMAESPCDAFGVGHSSTSISAALGMAAARDIRRENYSVVAIIGDGALTGGEAFEGLNNVGDMKKNIIVILNDNEMSIDKNVGALSEYLSKLMVTPQYNRAKKDVGDLIKSIPHIGGHVWRTAEIIKDGVTKAITPGGLFEELGFHYLGPLDGHNISELQQVFRQAITMEGPILIHVRTIKGRGFLPAEMQPEKFHGVGRFDPVNGKSVEEKSPAPSYTSVFADALVKMARDDKAICAITAAMPSGTGLNKFMQAYPDRFFDVGIAEEHAMTMAAGLAAAGMKPFIALYSTFAQRAYDQVIHDICLQNLPVRICLDRGGLVGSDGPTHHGVFDYSFLRHIPNMTVMAPKDENELCNMLYTMSNFDGPVSVRYPRGNGQGVEMNTEFTEVPIGKGEILQRDGDTVILAVGTMVYPALETAKLLAEDGIKSTVVNMRFIKPLDTALIDEVRAGARLIVTMEENALAGGFGSAVLEYLSDESCTVPVMRFGIRDEFIEQGTIDELYELCGLTPAQMAAGIKGRILPNG